MYTGWIESNYLKFNINKKYYNKIKYLIIFIKNGKSGSTEI